MTNTNYPSATPQTPPPAKSNNNKNILIGILAAGLLGTWGYLLYDKNNSNEKLQVAQTQGNMYMSARDSVQGLYNETLSRLDSITGSNNNLQGQLSERNSDITKLKNEINGILRKKNATQSELDHAKQLITQLNEKVAGLEAEVTRLNGENQQLIASNTQLSTEKETLTQNLATTQTEKDELAKTVDVGSTFSASNIQITPINDKKNGREKVTTTAKRVDKLVVTFDVENRIAKSGPTDMYVMVTAPDGKVITDETLGSGTLTTRNDGDRTYTKKVSIDYEQGTTKKIDVSLPQKDFKTGDYKIEIYQNGFKIGEGTRSLKKGGLFS